MTNEQKDQTRAMRTEGKSYAEIANALGIPRSTISNFCRRDCTNMSSKNLISSEGRGNTVNAGGVERQRIPAPTVTVVYAEQPNEEAFAEALRILANER